MFFFPFLPFFSGLHFAEENFLIYKYQFIGQSIPTHIFDLQKLTDYLVVEH